MSKRRKLVERMRRNPKHVRFEEIETLLIGLGFTQRQKGSSHSIFTKENSPSITVPFRRPTVLPVYVELVLDTIEPFLDEPEA